MGILNDRKKVKEMKSKIESIKPKALLTCIFQEGLPTKNDGYFKVLLCNNQIMILDIEHEFILNFKQIREIEAYEYKNIEKELQTSTAKAIAGAALFGTAGAIIGSQPKKKITKDESISYLIIKYINSQGVNSEIKLNSGSVLTAMSDIKKFKDFARLAQEFLSPIALDKKGTIQL